MSGPEYFDPNWHCRIGKVTKKKPVKLARIKKKAKGRVRAMLMEMVIAVDKAVEDGHPPLCAFAAVVHTDGRVTLANRFNKTATDSELAKLNWRQMEMLFADAAHDCRSFNVYHQTTPYDLVNEVLEEEE